MAADPRKRQKKLAKQKAKRKEKKHLIAKEKNLGLAQQLARSSSAPILECWRGSELFESGIGYVMFSRQLPNGFVAFAVFLVDSYCLGVKGAFGGIISRTAYDGQFHPNKLPQQPLYLKPECARKLVEEAVAYAQEIGLAPHPDYHKATAIFGDIEAFHCDEEFEFGFEGLPYFIAGPTDSPQRCQMILNSLARTCGPNNFKYLISNQRFVNQINVPGSSFPGIEMELPGFDLVDEDDFEEGEDDQEEE